MRQHVHMCAAWHAHLELRDGDGLWVRRPGVTGALETSEQASTEDRRRGRQLLLLQRLQQAAATAGGQRQELGGPPHAGRSGVVAESGAFVSDRLGRVANSTEAMQLPQCSRIVMTK